MRKLALCLSLFTVFAGVMKADDIAYIGTGSDQFGTIDLNTGVFTSIGSSGVTLAGMAVESATLYATSWHTVTGTLYTVNVATAAVTAVGTSAIDYDDFGSTLTGLYAVGTDGNLYSINASTGAATLLGSLGIGFGSWRGLSTNSATLYFSDGTNLYTLNTTTGAATLVGALGGSEEEGAILLEDGKYYAGQDAPTTAVDTLNVTTGAATIGPALSGGATSFFALAPDPLPSTVPSPTPEPGSITLLGTGLAALAAVLRGRVRLSSR
jgi:hypothetical protein